MKETFNMKETLSMIKELRRALSAIAAVCTLAVVAAAPSAALADEQYFAIPSMRVGPYNAMGTGYYAGVIDYLNYVNIKQGGVNGVKLTYEECETEYNAARNVECYQRLMNKGNQKMLVWDPYGTPLAYSVIGRVTADNVVLAQAGYGRTDAADGRVWPWVFGAHSNYWSQIAMKLNFIQQQEGGIAKMKGKTIVHLHIDTAYGREPLPAMRTIAKDWGFKLLEIPVAPPGLEQQSQWLQIRKEKADWVTFWGAGAGMSGTALTTAARVGFPRNRVIFVTFGGAEEDMIAGGAAAKDTYVVAHALPGKQWPLITDIQKVVYDGAKTGNLPNTNRIGTIYYNRGVIAAVNWIEAMKKGQKMHNKVGKTITGAEFRDGYESLDYTDAAYRKQLGIDGMIPPFKLSCRDHEGAGKFHMMRWDGAKFQIVTKDWMGPNEPAMIRTLIEQSAEKYAKENNITLRDCKS
jgi:branched-chain amino acid transport system substrate-binding protein